MVPESSYIDVDGVRTHYFDLGVGPVVVLLHSGEFGGSAELCWEFNFEALSHHFRVVAPDWLGYGQTDKLFDFEDMWSRWVRHISRFLALLNIDRANFVGNSMGASTLVTVAALSPCPWSIDRMVVASGGGAQPRNAARETLNSYDGTKDHMRRIIEAVFVRADLRDDPDYLERRFQSSRVPGAWECTAASRFHVPDRPSASVRRPASYRSVPFETLLLVGAEDSLREPGYALPMAGEIPRCQLLTLQNAGHCPQIDQPGAFNDAVTSFLTDGVAGNGSALRPGAESISA